MITLDTLKAIVRDMRLEAREWEGIDPINRRVSRRLNAWADRLEEIGSGNPSTYAEQGAGNGQERLAQKAHSHRAPEPASAETKK